MSKELIVEVEIPDIDVSKLPTRKDAKGTTVPLVTKHQATVAWLNVVEGLTRQQIADILGITKGSVDSLLYLQHVKEYASILAQGKLGSIAVKAVHKLGNLIDHKSGYVSLEAVKTALTAGGYMDRKSQNSLEISGNNVQVNIDLGG